MNLLNKNDFSKFFQDYLKVVVMGEGCSSSEYISAQATLFGTINSYVENGHPYILADEKYKEGRYELPLYFKREQFTDNQNEYLRNQMDILLFQEQREIMKDKENKFKTSFVRMKLLSVLNSPQVVSYFNEADKLLPNASERKYEAFDRYMLDINTTIISDPRKAETLMEYMFKDNFLETLLKADKKTEEVMFNHYKYISKMEPICLQTIALFNRDGYLEDVLANPLGVDKTFDQLTDSLENDNSEKYNQIWDLMIEGGQKWRNVDLTEIDTRVYVPRKTIK